MRNIVDTISYYVRPYTQGVIEQLSVGYFFTVNL